MHYFLFYLKDVESTDFTDSHSKGGANYYHLFIFDIYYWFYRYQFQLFYSIIKQVQLNFAKILCHVHSLYYLFYKIGSSFIFTLDRHFVKQALKWKICYSNLTLLLI